MMAKCLRLIILFICCLEGIRGEEYKKTQVCKESEILEKLFESKPAFKDALSRSWSDWMKPSPRSLFKALQNCTVYHGSISINVHSTGDTYTKFDENVRTEDLLNLKYLETIYGVVYLNLGQYRHVKNLSFLSSLKKIETSGKPGFSLLESYVEMIGFMNVRLNVPFTDISDNFYLCYLERFQTINSSSGFRTDRNKEYYKCKLEGKICSSACNPSKGCWGPSERHCFECRHWTADNECVNNCESKPGFFTPSEGRVCGRCMKCGEECVGANNTLCPEQNDYCPKHMFFNNDTGGCEECAPSCFGAGYSNCAQTIIRACSGPGNVSGPGGCSLGCPEMTFLTISSKGLLECSPCHSDCLSCQNASLSGCLERVKNDWRANQGSTTATFGGVIMGLIISIIGLRCMELWRRRSKRLLVDVEARLNSETPLLMPPTNLPSHGMMCSRVSDNGLAENGAKGLLMRSYRSKQLYRRKLTTSTTSTTFSVNDRNEIQDRGKDGLLSYIKCHFPYMTPGWKSFAELRSILDPLFTGEKIKKIRQDLGRVAGNSVARVISRDDEVVGLMDGPYCGMEHSREEVEMWQQRIDAESDCRALIISGRRTVLEIRHITPYDILISYERSSEDLVVKIYCHLIANGFSCRMNKKNIKNINALLEDINNCRVMLVCITEEYLKSETCIREIEQANWSRHNSSFPIILPIMLEDMQWPPKNADRRVRNVLSQEQNVCRLQEDNIDNLMKQLKRITSGTELLVIFNEDHFTPVDRDEIQFRGKYVWSGSYIKCHVPQMSGGWKTFREMRSVLGPLFTGKDIKEIEQDRGKVAGKDVVKAISRDDQVVNPWGGPYCDMDGKEHSWREVDTPRQLIIHAESGRDVLVIKGRRTVLEISHTTTSISTEEEASYGGTRLRQQQEVVKSNDNQ